MLRRTTAALFLAAALAPAAARAGDGCKPVYGFYTSQVQDPATCGGFCTAGELIGGIQATYAFVQTGVTGAPALGGDPALAAVIFYVGRSVVTLKRGGDEVHAFDAGSIDLAGGKQAALLVVQGGTGAYAAATGFLQLRGTLDLQSGHVTGDYSGELCTP